MIGKEKSHYFMMLEQLPEDVKQAITTYAPDMWSMLEKAEIAYEQAAKPNKPMVELATLSLITSRLHDIPLEAYTMQHGSNLPDDLSALPQLMLSAHALDEANSQRLAEAFGIDAYDLEFPAIQRPATASALLQTTQYSGMMRRETDVDLTALGQPDTKVHSINPIVGKDKISTFEEQIACCDALSALYMGSVSSMSAVHLPLRRAAENAAATLSADDAAAVQTGYHIFQAIATLNEQIDMLTREIKTYATQQIDATQQAIENRLTPPDEATHQR